MKKPKLFEILFPNDFYVLDLIKASHLIVIILIIGLFIIVFRASSSIELTGSFYTLAKNVVAGFLIVYVLVALPRMS